MMYFSRQSLRKQITMIKGIGHLGIVVKDIEKSLDAFNCITIEISEPKPRRILNEKFRK